MMICHKFHTNLSINTHFYAVRELTIIILHLLPSPTTNYRTDFEYYIKESE